MNIEKILENFGYIKKEKVEELERDKTRLLRLVDQTDQRCKKYVGMITEKGEVLKELAKENKALKAENIAIKKEYSDEVLKCFELAKFLESMSEDEFEKEFCREEEKC